MSLFLPRTPRLRLALALADGGWLAVAGWLAHMVRFSAGTERVAKLNELLSHPGLLATGFVAMWATAVAAELYEPIVLRRRREVATRVAIVAAVWGVALVVATYLVPGWRFGRGLLLITTAAWAVGAVVVRDAVALWLRRRPRPRALVVGEAGAVEEICRKLVVLAGIVSGADGFASDLTALQFSGVPVVVASELWAWLDGRLPVDELSPSAFLHQPGFSVMHWELFNRVTRVVDIAAGVALLLVCLPVLLLAMLAVLVFDGRPVLFLQTRVGQFGRRFRVIKLRTMRPDADEHRRKLEYDLYFIRERSFGIYLLTLLRTASVALVGARR